jgi:hypothetical protein
MSRRYYGRRKPMVLFLGKIAKWLRPGVFIAENGLNIRRISMGLKSCPSKKTIGWAVGDKKHVPPFLWQA